MLRRIRKYFVEILGVFVVLGVPLWLYIIVPELVEIPEGFSYEADVVSYDNFFDKASGEFSGDQQSVTNFSYRTIQGGSGNIVVRNVFDVRSQDGQPIFSVARDYHVDAHTWKHIPGPETDREGYLFGPRMKGLYPQASDKASFTYWHVNYDVPIFLEYEDEEEIGGLLTYRYEADFSADQTNELTGSLVGVGDTMGVRLDVHIKVWIEPTTGYMVAYSDSADAYFYDLETKEQLYAWNTFRNNYTRSSIDEHVAIASSKKQQILFLEFGVPFISGLFVLILLLLRNLVRSVQRDEMIPRASKKRSLLDFGMPLLISLLIIVVSIAACLFTVRSIEQQIEEEFRVEVGVVQQAIRNRLEVYISALRGGRGFFSANEFVSREEWRTYVNNLNLQSTFPGIQGIGYSQVVLPEEREAHIEAVRAEGFPSFTIRPEGERDIYTSIVYLEPFDERNQQAFGFDMFQQETRRSAMEFARDTDSPALSGMVTLVQEIDEDVQAGFLIYVPLYKSGAPHATVQERREHIQGYVYSPFRMGNFMRDIFSAEQSQLDVEIFDGRTESFVEENKMYTSDKTLQIEGRITAARTLELGGHTWVVRYSAPQGYGFDLFRESLPYIILGGGFLSSIFLFFITYVLNTRREKALALASRMTNDLNERTKENEKITRELAEVNVNLKKQSEKLAEKIEEVELINSHLIGRELKMVELKDQLKKQSNDKRS